jgi:hypothetical protein
MGNRPTLMAAARRRGYRAAMRVDAAICRTFGVVRRGACVVLINGDRVALVRRAGADLVERSLRRLEREVSSCEAVGVGAGEQTAQVCG